MKTWGYLLLTDHRHLKARVLNQVQFFISEAQRVSHVIFSHCNCCMLPRYSTYSSLCSCDHLGECSSEMNCW